MAIEKIQAIRGMSDMLPEDAPLWHFFEKEASSLAKLYGYQHIRTPIVEQTRLFKRGIGEVTDIVEKEMYSFVDSLNGDELSLRPENTASVVRACIEHNLLYEGPKRLWYMGPMFRHERPQRGRYRQFHQFGMEAMGFKGPDTDAEQLLMLNRLWKRLGIAPVRLELNCLGQLEDRKAYREVLIQYFEAHKDILDEDASRRLYSNPLRILDTKNPDMQDLVNNAPKLYDSLGEESKQFLADLEAILKAEGIDYVVNPRLVRGLDYYNLTVFEWVTDKLGAQGTICGGGRYDPLIGMLGGRDAPACGFAMGIERVLELMKECGVKPESRECDVYVVWDKALYLNALSAAERLRDADIATIIHSGSMKFGNQMKRADASGALYALVIGADEAAAGKVGAAALDGLRHQMHGLVLPDDLLFQLALKVCQLCELGLPNFDRRNAGPQLDDLGHIVHGHLDLAGSCLLCGQVGFELCNAGLALGHALVVDGLVHIRILHLGFFLLEGIQLLLHPKILGNDRVGQIAAGAGFVQQVDGLIGQEAVQDVPLGEHHSPLHHKVAHLYTVVVLVVFLNAPQHLDGVLNGRLSHLHGLEAPLQRSILFNVLAVLVKGRSTNDLNFSAGKRRL